MNVREYVRFYPNNQKRVHTYQTVRGGEYHGEYRYWYSDGQIMIHTHYENGKEHGECKQWYPNGQLKLEKTYKEGKLNGPYKDWYDTGVLKCKANYMDDQQDGVYEYWFENGQQHFQGTSNKIYKQWSIDGKLIINTTSS